MSGWIKPLIGLAVLLQSTIAVSGDTEAPADPMDADFERLVVTVKPFELAQPMHLTIQPDGSCAVKVEPRPAMGNVPARGGANFECTLSPDRVRRINVRLKATDWLTAPKAEGPPRHTHPDTITIAVTRKGKTQSVVCQGRRDEPYHSLLHALRAIELQERRFYEYTYVGGERGRAAWADIGREIAALRGDPYQKPVYEIDYARFLSYARHYVRRFHSADEAELVPAIRIIGHLKSKEDLPFLHRMGDDRSSGVRREVAWALYRLRDNSSLPVLARMAEASNTRQAAGLRLIQWGDDAVPYIIALIEKSTDENLEHRENIIGEQMIRAYLYNWDTIDHPINPKVCQAVEEALKRANPENGTIRTKYHKEFLDKMKSEQE